MKIIAQALYKLPLLLYINIVIDSKIPKLLPDNRPRFVLKKKIEINQSEHITCGTDDSRTRT